MGSGVAIIAVYMYNHYHLLVFEAKLVIFVPQSGLREMQDNARV